MLHNMQRKRYSMVLLQQHCDTVDVVAVNCEHFITALESLSELELTYDYVVAKLMNYDLRKKENGAPSSNESALVMQQKSDVSKLTCFYCKESGHFKRDYPKLNAKNKKHGSERANNVKDN